MGLVRTHLAILDPLLDTTVLVPSVIPREGLLRRCTRVLENLILTLEDSNSLNRLLIWVF